MPVPEVLAPREPPAESDAAGSGGQPEDAVTGGAGAHELPAVGAAAGSGGFTEDANPQGAVALEPPAVGGAGEGGSLTVDARTDRAAAKELPAVGDAGGGVGLAQDAAPGRAVANELPAVGIAGGGRSQAVDADSGGAAAKEPPGVGDAASGGVLSEDGGEAVRLNVERIIRCACSDSDVVGIIHENTARLNGIRGSRDRLPWHERYTIDCNLQPAIIVVKGAGPKVKLNGEESLQDRQTIEGVGHTDLIASSWVIPQAEDHVERAVGRRTCNEQSTLISEFRVASREGGACAKSQCNDRKYKLVYSHFAFPA